MTDTLIEQTAELERRREWMRYQMAAELGALKTSGGWHTMHVREDGTAPSTWRKFLEAYTDQVRQRVPGSLSTGTVEELLAQYEWISRMGGTTEEMALIGYEGLKGLRKMYGELPLPEATENVQNALAEIHQHGKFFLPNMRPPGTVTVRLRLKDLVDKPGFYAVKGLILQKDNVQYADNIIPHELGHWLSKRLRAATEIED